MLTIRDEVFESPLTGVPTGFPDVIMQPDWSTLVPVPWERDLSAVIVGRDGEGRRAARASIRGSSCGGRSTG